MLIALAFAHFLSKLLLKEQMIKTPLLKKAVNNTGHIDAKNPVKLAVFYWLFLGEVSSQNFPWNRPIFSKNLPLKIWLFPLKSHKISRFFCEFWLFSSENPTKLADFSTNFDFFPAKTLQNRLISPRILTFFPWKSCEIGWFFREFAPENPAKFCFFSAKYQKPWFMQAYTVYLSFPQKKIKPCGTMHVSLCYLAVHNFQINNSNRKCSHRSPAYLRT